jgi:HlyD family secretion protein
VNKFNRITTQLVITLVACFAFVGCSKKSDTTWQGYLEGEFVYVATPLGGRLDHLAVSRGQQVKQSDLLFTLECDDEKAALAEANAQLSSAKAKLADAKKGLRPSELSSLEARLGQARANAELAQINLIRQEELFREKVISQSDYDHARLTYEANQKTVEQATSDLVTARLGARSDLVQAAQAEVYAADAAKKRADWSVNQKIKFSPTNALVYDTLYRPGEFVAAGMPVVTLLPPENLKIRFFVTESAFGKLKPGDKLSVVLSDKSPAIKATLNYFAPQPEYTPPILFNRDNRAKLVYMCEAHFDQVPDSTLHPGQPVDISLLP